VNATAQYTVAQIRDLVSDTLAGADIRSVVTLGEGCDHVAFEVNDELIARIRKDDDGRMAEGIGREIGLLDVLGRVSPIPVPEVIAANPAAGLIVLRRLPGISLLDRPPADPMVLVDQLVGFLTAIHGVPLGEVRHLVETDDYPFDAHLADAQSNFTRVASHLPPEGRRAVEAFLMASPPPASKTAVLCHNDLGAEHLLASHDGTIITGAFDWTDAAIADPAKDLGLPLRDLGPALIAAVAARLKSDAHERILERAKFYARCGLLEDLVYGLTVGHRRYAERAMAHLRLTFGD
jgi:aminoglycoside phosphotransferase (APT) family kinase protein